MSAVGWSVVVVGDGFLREERRHQDPPRNQINCLVACCSVAPGVRGGLD